MGWGAAQLLGAWLLGRGVPLSAGIVVVAVGASLVVALGGMIAPLRHVLRLEPTRVLHEA
jgi:predicted lysophospholipase L1 biosynthesis ABC-type transport system permease subunit